MTNASVCMKNAPPGSNVIGSFDALIRSGSSSPPPDVGRRQHPILTLKDDLLTLGHLVGAQRRQANTQVDVGAIGDVRSGAFGDPIPGSFRDVGGRVCGLIQGHRGLRSFSEMPVTGLQSLITRSTKMPGVTITSGSRSPKSTISPTCTTVVFAAMAITGPKLRADLL